MATKKCMQCGGTTKKMAKGGSAKKECPPGYHMDGGICRPNTLKPLGAKLGVGAVLAGGAAMIGSAIKNKMAARKAKKLETAKTASKTTDTSKLEKKAKGGMPTRTMGSSDIVGMPKYGNNPRTDQGRMLQKGGSFAPNRAVQASCKGGMVRDENGRCVMARKMAKGGFPDLNKDGRITKADVLKGRGVIKRMGGSIKKK